ncbi:MAG: hypothetical protein GEU28_00770 [Dehalococcoidia bacterium]|nr:hypothetical protein [Dehalococcoidia bacterium]
MAAEPSTKDAIRRIIDGMSNEEAERLLDYLNMLADPHELSEDERARVEAAEERMGRGEYSTLRELQGELGV